MKAACPECEYIEEETIDPNLLSYINFSPIVDYSDKDNFCLNMITNTEIVTTSDVKKYQTELINRIFDESNDTSYSHIDIDGFIIHAKVPSMNGFISYGDEFNKNLLMAVQSRDKAVIAAYLRFSFFKILAPWVKSITKITDPENKKGIRARDIATIAKILDHLQKDKERAEKFSNFILNFMKRSSLVHTCYPVNACPNCKKDLSEAVNGFVMFDPQKTFFIMSATRLALT